MDLEIAKRGALEEYFVYIPAKYCTCIEIRDPDKRIDDLVYDYTYNEEPPNFHKRVHYGFFQFPSSKKGEKEWMAIFRTIRIGYDPIDKFYMEDRYCFYFSPYTVAITPFEKMFLCDSRDDAIDRYNDIYNTDVKNKPVFISVDDMVKACKSYKRTDQFILSRIVDKDDWKYDVYKSDIETIDSLFEYVKPYTKETN